MTYYKQGKKFFVGLILILSVGAAFALRAEGTTNGGHGFSPYVDAQGNIKLPDDFRRSMVHLGTWFVPEGDAGGFHDVYANGDDVDHYRRIGKWPDGAVIVKELRGASSGSYTTGKGVSHANEKVKQWFVMIKDTENRFSSNPNWGEGWGWALFKTDNPAKNASVSYKTDCLGCHVPAKVSDWIYVEGLPTLSKNK